MFSFLKQKIKDAVSAITKKFEKEENKEEPTEINAQEIPKTPSPQTQPIDIQLIVTQPTGKDAHKPTAPQEERAEKPAAPKEKEKKKQQEKVPVEILAPVVLETAKPELEEKKNTETKHTETEATTFFGKITQKISTTKISTQEFEDIFWNLEVSLLENNVAVEVIDVLKKKLAAALVEKPVKRGQVTTIIAYALAETISDVLSFPPVDFLKTVKTKCPYVICFVGINGSGKTTTIAKIAHFLKKNKLSCVLAAGDTFRAAAIQQLEEHAKKIGVKIIKQDYGSDAAAVAFDAIAYAKAHNIDVVLIDTAGRMHSNINLRDEMKKIVRVAKPDMILFIGESITGNDCIEQAKQFQDAVGITGIVLAKADVDEKGGAALSIAYVTGKPIIFLGTGQRYEDLQPFSKEFILVNLGLGKA